MTEDDQPESLAEFVAFAREQSDTLIAIDRVLAPVRAQVDNIKREIQLTFGGRRFTFAGSEARRIYYEKALRLHIEHGPLREQRRQVKADLDWATRLIAALRKAPAPGRSRPSE